MSMAGRLKSRLALQAPTGTPDGQGGVIRNYATVATVWAAVTWLGPREGMEADAAGANLRARIVLRDEIAVTPAHRLVDGARVYRITALRAGDGFIEIDAECRIA